jgi:hypothetical protein
MGTGQNDDELHGDEHTGGAQDKRDPPDVDTGHQRDARQHEAVEQR